MPIPDVKDEILINKAKAGMRDLKRLLVEMTDRVENECNRRNNLVEFAAEAGRESDKGMLVKLKNIAGDETGGEDCPVANKWSITEDDMKPGIECVEEVCDLIKVIEEESLVARKFYDRGLNEKAVTERLKAIWDLMTVIEEESLIARKFYDRGLDPITEDDKKAVNKRVKAVCDLMTVIEEESLVARQFYDRGLDPITEDDKKAVNERVKAVCDLMTVIEEESLVAREFYDRGLDPITEDDKKAASECVKATMLNEVTEADKETFNEFIEKVIVAHKETSNESSKTTLNEVTEANEETFNEVTEADEETSFAEAEELGNLAIKSVSVTPVPEGECPFPEENGFESPKRVNGLDEKLVVLHDECAKSAVEWCINRMRVGSVMDADEVFSLASKLVVSSKECEVLIGEFAECAAELCTLKIYFGDLVNKLDIRKMLRIEINEIRRMIEELLERLTAFKRIIRVQSLEFNRMERDVCDEEVENINELVASASAFTKQSSRVLLEMTTTTTGVKLGKDLASVADLAALADEWAAVTFGKCILKVCVGVLVEKQSIIEVLESEIDAAWRMEKKVKDRLMFYHVEQEADHSQQGSAASATVVVEGDERRYLKDGLMLAWQKVSPFAVGMAVGCAATVLGGWIWFWFCVTVGLFAVGVSLLWLLLD